MVTRHFDRHCHPRRLETRPTRRCHWLRILGLSGCLILAAGCDSAPQGPSTRSVRTSSQSAREHIDKAMEYLENLDQYSEEQARMQTAYHLNRWLDTQSAQGKWEPDPLVQRLPLIVREQGVTGDLSRQLFTVEDSYLVQEAVWMRQISQWVSRQPLPRHVADWLADPTPPLNQVDAEKLGIAYRLFDWTVRNIRLDELIASPDEAAVAPVEGTLRADRTPASLRAVAGPGYYFEPWQVLIYGHGDAWMRMRVFTLLARQQGLDVVTLAFPGRSIPPRPRPWVSALLLNDQLYLFDLRLGLAIPQEGFTGIATLAEVLDKPELLSQLEIDEEHPYDVEARDLAEIAALIDVVGPNLSWRMQLLEAQLLGEHRTALSVKLSPLSERLKACQGVYDVYVWSLPFEAVWYRNAYERILAENQQAMAVHMFTFAKFMNHSPLARARYLYFRGQLESEEEQTGAKALLMESRVNKDQLEQLATNEDVQLQLGMQRTGRESEEVWQMQLEGARQVILGTKQCATFWLGLLQLESGSFDSAIEWLQTRTLEAWPDSEWTPAARYNLARAYEAQGDLGKAQEVLLADKSLQAHGNYLRARILQKQLAQKPAAAPPSP